MNGQRRTIAFSLVAGLGLAVACGTANEATLPSGSSPLSAGMGQLSVALVDAPAAAVDEIWVNVTRVTAHSTAAGWVVLSDAPFTVDLLKLQASAKQLGLLELPPGKITQIRLVVSPDGNYVVTQGQQVPLVVPSGSQSGIKIHGPWDITECSRTAITLDFDGKRSIWYHPAKKGTEWILRPVIRVRDASSTAVGCADGGTGPADGGETPPACDNSESFCSEALYCVSGACVPGAGEPCAQNSGCASGTCAAGTCAPGGPRTPCAVGGECLSGTCSAAACQPSGPGQPCLADADCSAGTCTEGECGPGDAKGANGTCTVSSECLSNACSGGVCQPGGQGSLCSADADCLEGLSCTSGVCDAIPLPM